MVTPSYIRYFMNEIRVFSLNNIHKICVFSLNFIHEIRVFSSTPFTVGKHCLLHLFMAENNVVVNIKCPNKTLYYINMILNSFVFLDKIHPCIYITPVYYRNTPVFLDKYTRVST